MDAHTLTAYEDLELDSPLCLGRQKAGNDLGEQIVGSGRRFLLVGHSGFYNRGCEAIVRCTVDIIRQVVPDSSIVLSSYDSEADAAKIRALGVRVDEVLPACLNGVRGPSLAWAWQGFHRRVLWRGFAKRDYSYRKYYKQADVVISVGGDNFSDDYGSPEGFFRMLDAAKRCGAKTVIWGASVGPFSPPEAERAWTQHLKRVDLITAREDMTVEYLAGLGVVKNVHRVCDPAFLLPAVEPRITVPLGDSSRMKVGIGMSALMHMYGAMQQYVDAHVGLIEHVTANYDADIVVVPHVIQDAKTRNDSTICEEIARRVGRKCRCYVLPKTLDACELKHCISRCNYFVGARTHSTIASLSSLVPTISIGYSVKAWGINQDLLGSADYVVDSQAMQPDVLIAKFEQLHERQRAIVRRLQVSVPQAKDKAERAGQHLLQLIGGTNGCRR